MPTLTITAPEGAHFDFDEVKTAKGTSSLGEVPILTWDDTPKMIEFYGEEGIRDIANGTSLRVSFQAIARRYKIAGKSDDDIADAMVKFRPGRHSPAASTPASRSQRLARSASEKLGDNAPRLEELLQKIASGEISFEDVAALVG